MMENHFHRMLAVGDTSKRSMFIEAKSYIGSKKGYVFQMGDQGLGYYYDPAQGAIMEDKVKLHISLHYFL